MICVVPQLTNYCPAFLFSFNNQVLQLCNLLGHWRKFCLLQTNTFSSIFLTEASHHKWLFLITLALGCRIIKIHTMFHHKKFINSYQFLDWVKIHPDPELLTKNETAKFAMKDTIISAWKERDIHQSLSSWHLEIPRRSHNWLL